ncbi:MFS transporter [Hwanghaeella grinnelliae]|uniref:MFS transporter n=1 Tax=Hwanghaeella grinnelliae TaxID=2500179 RepID=A0A437QL63_9PROT|nr:MFS transporter [Hwanghaeella grinnelliae]
MPQHKRKVAVIAGVIGNVMEWYDFALYGYMAAILAHLFFPGDSKVASLLAVYGTFAAGFIMRPIGSALFGWLGDTTGRSATMMISVSMMVVPTVALGLLPTYATIGIAAPIFLVIIRLAQGLSVGGEFSSSVTYLVETSPPGQRGLSGSFANVGSLMGSLLGSGMAAAVTWFLNPADLHEWGWRLPFLFGGVLGVSAIYLRRHLPKSEHFAKHVAERGKTSPLAEAFLNNRRQMMQGTLFAASYGSLYYLILVYLPTWLSHYTPLALKDAMPWNTLATALLIPIIPLAGWISDRYFRRTHVLVAVMLTLAGLAIPMFHFIKTGDPIVAGVAQIVFALLIAFPCGIGPALFTELFPTRDRLSGYSVSFNVGMGLVGGATPALVTWLISVTGYDALPGLFMVVAGLIAAVSLIWMRDRSREPLE